MNEDNIYISLVDQEQYRELEIEICNERQSPTSFSWQNQAF